MLLAIVDDDPVFQYITKRLITSVYGVDDILQFKDGQEAIDFFLSNKREPKRLPDILLLDINMPFLSGWAFLKEYKKIEFEGEYLPRIFICSSSTDDQDYQKAKDDQRVSGYLHKPLQKEDLSELFEQV